MTYNLLFAGIEEAINTSAADLLFRERLRRCLTMHRRDALGALSTKISVELVTEDE